MLCTSLRKRKPAITKNPYNETSGDSPYQRGLNDGYKDGYRDGKYNGSKEIERLVQEKKDLWEIIKSWQTNSR